jgi:N-methylhydantoinase A/oxoprolinase/acetone carboxylase beta subunit
MERAIRVVSVERGHDPRDFALVAFGGAGGMHACEIAERLELGTVIVPRYAGVLSALGMLAADVTRDYSASVLKRSTEISIAALKKVLAPLVAQADRHLASEGFPKKRRSIACALDVRYAGQSYEITVPFAAAYRADFDRRHGKTYGYMNPSRAVEVVNVRVTAAGVTAKPVLPSTRVRRTHTPAAKDIRRSRFGQKTWRTSFFHWDTLDPGARAAGPAVITGGEATVVIPPGFRFEIDAYRNVIARGRR